MILESLQNTLWCEKLHPLFKQVFDYIKSTDFSSFPEGKKDLGNDVSISIMNLTCKPKSEAVIETHDKYIDIQLPLFGVEKIGWKSRGELQEESIPYDEEKDITFYIDHPTAYTVYERARAIKPDISRGTVYRNLKLLEEKRQEATASEAETESAPPSQAEESTPAPQAASEP